MESRHCLICKINALFLLYHAVSSFHFVLHFIWLCFLFMGLYIYIFCFVLWLFGNILRWFGLALFSFHNVRLSFGYELFSFCFGFFECVLFIWLWAHFCALWKFCYALFSLRVLCMRTIYALFVYAFLMRYFYAFLVFAFFMRSFYVLL